MNKKVILFALLSLMLLGSTTSCLEVQDADVYFLSYFDDFANEKEVSVGKEMHKTLLNLDTFKQKNLRYKMLLANSTDFDDLQIVVNDALKTAPKLIICQDDNFASFLNDKATLYPTTTFLVFNGRVENPNIINVELAIEEAGFLLGYVTSYHYPPSFAFFHDEPSNIDFRRFESYLYKGARVALDEQNSNIRPVAYRNMVPLDTKPDIVTQMASYAFSKLDVSFAVLSTNKLLLPVLKATTTATTLATNGFGFDYGELDAYRVGLSIVINYQELVTKYVDMIINKEIASGHQVEGIIGHMISLNHKVWRLDGFTAADYGRFMERVDQGEIEYFVDPAHYENDAALYKFATIDCKFSKVEFGA
jgi:hypothetical protein